MNEQNEVGRLMEIVTVELRDHERRIVSLEKNDVKQDEQISAMTKSLDRIESNTTWTYRLVVGALVTGAIGGMIALFFQIATR